MVSPKLRPMAQGKCPKNNLAGKTENLDILPKHREFGLLTL